MKNLLWAGLLIFLFSTGTQAVQLTDEVRNLEKDDPIEYSEDGETWYPAHFLDHYVTPYCVAVAPNQDGTPNPSDCSGTSEHLVTIWYEPPQHPEGFRMMYVRPGTLNETEPDPEPQPDPTPDPVEPETPVHKCLVNPTTFSGPALRSPPDRLVNLITTGDSAFGTAQRIREDKEELMPRIDEIYRIISEVIKCEHGFPNE